MSSLKEFARLLKEAQDQQKENKVLDNFAKLLKETKLPSDKIEEVPNIESVLEETKISDTEILLEEVVTEITQTIDPIEQIASSIGKKTDTIETERWDDPLRRNPGEKFVTFKEMNDHYTNFLGRIQQQLSSIGGSGEVKFRYLDDVNRLTMLPSNDNYLLEYDAASGKVQFTSDIGAIDTILFNTEHINDDGIVGKLSWNKVDDTLNLNHPNGVVQQIGQELYAYVRNRTGTTISNGTVVQFAGAEQNGTSRLLITPFLADGTFPNLYGLGITTQDIPDGEDGFVTVWGKIRELNTVAFNVGDILYANPDSMGGLTNIKPTAPNNVMPIAAVLRKDAIEGEIFVRPTIEQRYFYGSFVDKNNHTAALINTPYAIPIASIEFSSGVIHAPTDNTDKSKIQVLQSGLYNFQFSTQFVSTNSSAKDVYIWPRKNGEDIPDSATRLSVVGNGVYFVASWNFIISMDSGDYFQLMWATTDTTVSITTSAPLTNGSGVQIVPGIPSTLLSVTQVAQ